MAAQDAEPVNILLVDDHPNSLLSLKAVLERPEYNLVLARSGSEALRQVLRQEFAVILMDVAMPGMDGFELASIIKERDQSKNIPIIFITATGYDLEHIFRGYTIGAVDYLPKPVDRHAVRTKVAVFVELYRQRKQLERQAVELRQAEVREQALLREHAEDALRESEVLYQLTFDEAPIGIGHASSDGRWTRVNRRLCAILGSHSSAVVGSPIEQIGTGDDRCVLAEQLASLRAGAGIYSGEHRLAPARRTPIWGAVTLSALRDESTGQVRRIIALVDDITERKQIELERSRLMRELREGIAARDDFIALATHELKTPVTPLRLQTASLLQCLEERPEDSILHKRLRRGLLGIDRAGKRLETLIDRLLDASRLTIGRINLEPQELDLTRVVAESVTTLTEEAERAGSAISLQSCGQVIGSWDHFRIQQIMSNLLSNAIKYGEGKAIEVSVEADQEKAIVSVRDHGAGIPDEAQQRIFERFERHAPVRHFGGFGLGLWVVRQLVEAHGGKVHLWSRPGDGSEFSVELPRQPAVVLPAAESGERHQVAE